KARRRRRCSLAGIKNVGNELSQLLICQEIVQRGKVILAVRLGCDLRVVAIANEFGAHFSQGYALLDAEVVVELEVCKPAILSRNPAVSAYKSGKARNRE